MELPSVHYTSITNAISITILSQQKGKFRALGCGRELSGGSEGLVHDREAQKLRAIGRLDPVSALGSQVALSGELARLAIGSTMVTTATDHRGARRF